MTELELYKFIQNHALECKWDDYGEMVLWIPFDYLEEFTELASIYDHESQVSVFLCSGSVLVYLEDICEEHDIHPLNICDNGFDRELYAYKVRRWEDWYSST